MSYPQGSTSGGWPQGGGGGGGAGHHSSQHSHSGQPHGFGGQPHGQTQQQAQPISNDGYHHASSSYTPYHPAIPPRSPASQQGWSSHPQQQGGGGPASSDQPLPPGPPSLGYRPSGGASSHPSSSPHSNHIYSVGSGGGGGGYHGHGHGHGHGPEGSYGGGGQPHLYQPPYQPFPSQSHARGGGGPYPGYDGHQPSPGGRSGGGPADPYASNVGSWGSGPSPSVLQHPQSSTQQAHPSGLPVGSRQASHTPTSTSGAGSHSKRPVPKKEVVDEENDFNDNPDIDDDEDENQMASDIRKGKGKADGSWPTPQQKGASDFVKKLFSMLDDQAYDGIVAWSASGDSFVVKDMNDFTKHVLPRNFRHSNFASFVRQLNKYDFHKVKNPDESGGHHVGEHLWEFQHPDFIRGREDLLENVKRKVPARKKAAAASSKANEGDSKRDESPLLPGAADSPEKAAESYAELKGQVASLTAMQEQMSNHINGLTKQYQGVIAEMLTFQKNMVQQDQLMQNLIQYLMNLEADRREDSSNQGSFLRGSDPFGNKEEAAHLIGNYKDVPKPSTSLSQMNEMSQRMASAHRPPQQSESSSRSNVDTLSTTSSTLQETSLTSSVPTLSPKSHASPSTNINLDPPLSPKSQRNARANGTAHAVKDGNSRDAAASFFHPRHHDAGAGSQEMLDQVVSNVANPSLAGFEKAGLKVFTVGTLQPRENDEDYVSSNDAKGNGARASASGAMKGSPPQDSDPSYGLSAPPIEELSAGGSKFGSTNASGGSKASSSVMGVSSARGAAPEGRPAPSGRGNNHLRVRRSTFVPGWAIPPRVLLVDDDAVCRRLSSKFLQVFGCSIDYAVDGVTAVNKMNLEKYDLVLMDIVMPNLDGVSATSLIRQFDPKTPIISMTSNSGPTELMNYISSGMNDILPKPFTKEGLLSMLEKHLIHLKTVQKMEDIPKSLGLGASSDGSLQSAPGAVATSTSNLGMTFHRSVPAGGGVDTGAPLMGHGPESSRQSVLGPSNGQTGDKSVLNPLAGMGFSDEEYIAMLQNLIAAGGTSDSVQGNLNNPAANFLGVVAGGDSGDGSTSKNSAPLGSAFVGMSSTFPSRGEGHHGRERSAQTSSEPMKRAACGGEDISNHGENKRSRFTELG